MKLIIEKLNDPFLKQSIFEKAKKTLAKNKKNIFAIVKQNLGEDFIDKEIHVNLVSQVGNIVYGHSKESQKKVFVSIEVPEYEISHILNILGWELIFALAKNKAYQIFFDKFKDYVIAEILADQIGVLIEKDIIYKVGVKNYKPSTILDHSSPRNPCLYKLQQILIENWSNHKKYKSLSEWLKIILKNFPSEIEKHELTYAYLNKKLDLITETLIQVLKELKRWKTD